LAAPLSTAPAPRVVGTWSLGWAAPAERISGAPPKGAPAAAAAAFRSAAWAFCWLTMVCRAAGLPARKRAPSKPAVE